MKEYGSEQGSSVQNRFTAYLVTAVKNKRISYMERKHQQTEFEAERPGVLERSYTDFEQEYRQYKLEHLPWKYNETPSIEQLIRVLEEGKLIGAIIKLKKREQEILIARVFEELDFKDWDEDGDVREAGRDGLLLCDPEDQKRTGGEAI